MLIKGFTKTTLLDYPGHVASTIFTGGCNFRCPFCHNGDLVLDPNFFPTIDEVEVLNHLKRRKGIITGVCITGGEPTLQPDLTSFINKIKALDLLIKLDTNGYNPSILKNLINSGNIDYIAMDIKSGRNNYANVTGIPEIEVSKIEESVKLIRSSSIDYEFRTTVVNGLHNLSDFEDIAIWLSGVNKYFIQSYKESEYVIDKSCSSFPKETLNEFLQTVINDIPDASLRGID